MKPVVITNASGVRYLRRSGEAMARMTNNDAVVPVIAERLDIRTSRPDEDKRKS